MPALSQTDNRLLDACLRYARRHRGQTAANPSVGTLIVHYTDDQPVMVGRGITAKGGRPHAERVALDRAREPVVGSTAYVSLEPCAHHGATPPCAQALIDAGISRVVTAWTDPDTRVDGKGHAMLRKAGLTVDISDTHGQAADDLRGYLNRKTKNRPQVILKLAVSADGKLGRPGEEVTITGALARRYVHRMRAEYDAILVGRGTVTTDDPELTCRLPGLERRSPSRFVLDGNAQLSPESKVAETARTTPISLITTASRLPPALAEKGVRFFASESDGSGVALPEMLEDMAASGVSSLMVEGGAKVAASFLTADLIDSIALFTGATQVGEDGIVSPITRLDVPDRYKPVRCLALGSDRLDLYERKSHVHRDHH